ncbi:threonine synthase [Salibacterium aidingense]|uniref:threonine synthase n=1 Tax=Salibacterium aidingense TaxID=384933 RepID=UPI003BD3C7BE
MKLELKCKACGHQEPVYIQYKCPKCGGIQEVSYEWTEETEAEIKSWNNNDDNSFWSYRRLYPIQPASIPVSLGEGNTPILPLKRLGERLGLSDWELKNEAVSPSGSFKDRPMAVASTFAIERHISTLVTASTGNTGVSASMYAARAGLRCKIYVPATTSREKLALIKYFGAEIVTIEGNFSEAYLLAKKDAADNDWFNVTSTFMNPIALEGNKSVAYELFRQKKTVPDWVIVPIGAGPLLVAVYKGFKELKRAGVITALPKMAGVQAAEVAPIVQAFQEGASEVTAWKRSFQTAAGGIADPLLTYPQDGTCTLQTIRESKGCALSISEEVMLYHRKVLAETEGIFLETASVTAISAAVELKEKGFADADDDIVSVGTGNGLKDMSSL